MGTRATGLAIEIIEFDAFADDADKLLSVKELDDLRVLLACNPEFGNKIPGTGGIRKLRVGLESKGKGKRGGARVIYYFHSQTMPLALLAIYAKGEKIDLTVDEKRELRSLVNEYVAQYLP
jgi:mRNA-degrading endonuclease RelE of RelBE toxin-antitoxin system